MSEKLKVLFVDDEPNILSGLRRMLRPLRHEWDMSFANNGYEALTILDEAVYDVVVTDMRMPGMDGANLLQEVALRHPHTVRFVLSGQSDHGTILRAVSTTHQFLSKPCNADFLKKVIGRAAALRDVIEDDELKNFISKIRSLPSPSETCHALVHLLDEEEAGQKAVSTLIGQDIALSAKMLQLVNSDLFGQTSGFCSADQAVTLVGVDVIQALVEMSDLFNEYFDECESELSLRKIQQHCRSVSALAGKVAGLIGANAEMASLVGLIHDVGKLIFILFGRERYAQLLSTFDDDQCHSAPKEKETFGASHSEAGAYLLSLWGFTDEVVQSIHMHHVPQDATMDEAGMRVLASLHIADVLVHLEEKSSDQLDEVFLERCSLERDINYWQKAVTSKNE